MGYNLGYFYLLLPMFFFFFFFVLFSLFFITWGGYWGYMYVSPPMNIISFNPYDIPLFNTIILLSSCVFITLSHFSLMISNSKNSWMGLLVTLFLGFMFSLGQCVEYSESMFSMSDSVYGALFFFLITEFHDLDVIISIIFLTVMFINKIVL